MLSTAEEYIWQSPVMLAPAESVMPWDIYKATLLAVVDLQYTLSYCTVVSSLIVHLYA